MRCRFRDEMGQARQLTLDDILVVAPVNAHVQRLGAALPAGARVGTVDRFQGQEASVVVYSTAASDPAHLPHGMEFLFSLNRLNVAISRAQALAVLVGSPELLRAWSPDPERLRLVNALPLRSAGESPRGAPALPVEIGESPIGCGVSCSGS